MVQLEDLLFEVEQANLPGTVDAHPNWRRRLAQPLETLKDEPMLTEIAAVMRDTGRSADG
jgi:4-alpha-glucanotransferase